MKRRSRAFAGDIEVADGGFERRIIIGQRMRGRKAAGEGVEGDIDCRAGGGGGGGDLFYRIGQRRLDGVDAQRVALFMRVGDAIRDRRGLFRSPAGVGRRRVGGDAGVAGVGALERARRHAGLIGRIRADAHRLRGVDQEVNVDVADRTSGRSRELRGRLGHAPIVSERSPMTGTMAPCKAPVAVTCQPAPPGRSVSATETLSVAAAEPKSAATICCAICRCCAAVRPGCDPTRSAPDPRRLADAISSSSLGCNRPRRRART